MYTEFLILYIGIAVSIVLSVVVIIMLGILLGRTNKTTNRRNNKYASMGNAGSAESMVFCRKCATQFSSTMNRCPNCNTPR